MIITDYLTEDDPLQWRRVRQLGIQRAVIRMPERKDFDLLDFSAWRAYVERFKAEGISPMVVEPLPGSLYEPVKCGLPGAEQALEGIKTIIGYMGRLGVNTLCLNFMAHVGWYRTAHDHPLRGGALSTAFDLADYRAADDFSISQAQLWRNLEGFLKAVVPTAEQSGVRLAFHPDDPPVPQLGGVARILTSVAAFDRLLTLANSDAVGVTLCQGCFSAMGENVPDTIRHFGKRIFFVHFRDVRGTREQFYETFHDDGQTDMPAALNAYKAIGFNGPVRVDHVPTMAGEDNGKPGYANLNRLYAIGYLRGLTEGLGMWEA